MNRLLIVFFLSILTPLSSFAEIQASGARKFYLHAGNDEIGNFKWGHFLACLKTVKFPNDPGPRELNMNISRLVITTIDNHKWVFSVREDEKKVILESITVDTHKYYTLNEKRRLFLRIIGNCDTNH